MKVLLVGHSHVVWLERYLRGAPKNVGLSEVEISYVGVRGGRVATFRNKPDEVARLAPDIIIIHLGGNDLESDRPPQQVGMELYELAKDYKNVGVKHVTVCRIIRWAQWRHLSVNEGNASFFRLFAMDIVKFIRGGTEGCGSQIKGYFERTESILMTSEIINCINVCGVRSFEPFGH